MAKFFDLQNTREKMKTMINSKHFDGFIMGLILLNAIDFGLMTSNLMSELYGDVLFLIDRLCMAIFLLEMAMKIFVYGKRFFHYGWNVFDFAVIAISSFPFGAYFIILRTFRLFRAFKYMRKFTGLRKMIGTLIFLLPNFFYALLISVVFVYVFAIIAVMLYGDEFVEFSDLGSATFALLQVFTLDGWASNIARPVMSIFPHAWIFFTSFVFVAFMIVSSFLVNAISDVIYRARCPQKKYTAKKVYNKK